MPSRIEMPTIHLADVSLLTTAIESHIVESHGTSGNVSNSLSCAEADDTTAITATRSNEPRSNRVTRVVIGRIQAGVGERERSGLSASAGNTTGPKDNLLPVSSQQRFRTTMKR